MLLLEPRNRIKINKFVPLFLIFVQFVGGISSINDDITNIWYFGCRWFGGMTTILTCNCTPEAEEMYIQKNTIVNSDTSLIQINDCNKVKFGGYSMVDLRNLRTISLNNIGNLILEANSFSWMGYRDFAINQEERFDLSIPSLKISIKNSEINEIGSYSFTGRINEISMINVKIKNLEAFAFSNILQMENLKFQDSVLEEVKPQAFKKFGTEFLELNNVSGEYLPSRTFSNVTVYRTFTIKDCKFKTLRPGTFIINNPIKFSMENCEIQQLQGEALLLSTTGDVLFKNNHFHEVQDHAFKGINIPSNEMLSQNKRLIIFDSNTFGNLEKYTLDVQPQMEIRLIALKINEICQCEEIVENKWKSEFYHEISCLIQITDDGEENNNNYVTVEEFKNNNCSVLTGYHTIIIGMCVLILIISLVVIGFYIYYVMVYKRQKYGCDKSDNKIPLSLIVPDGRTYKETEFHVIVEKADLLTTDL